MKNLSLVLALLTSITTTSFAQNTQNTQMSKENLISVQEKFLSHQQECRSIESNIENDPFLTNLDADVAEGVREGRVSKEAGERVVKMINTFIKLSHGLCRQVDHAVEMIEKKLKSDDANSSFIVSDFETQIQSTTQSAVAEMLALAEVPHLEESEQEMLMIIGQVMKRAVKHLLPEKAN